MFLTKLLRGSYNALKVDVWSLGATVWEMAEADPPFSDVTDPRQLGSELPELSEADIYSQSFHDFLNLCSRPSHSRPDPHELLNVRFLNAAMRVKVLTYILYRHLSSEPRVGGRRLWACSDNARRWRSACHSDRAWNRQGRCRGHSISLLTITIYPRTANYPPLVGTWTHSLCLV